MEGKDPNKNIAIIDAHTGDRIVVDYDRLTNTVSDFHFGEARWHTVPPVYATKTAKRERYDLEKMVSEGFYGFGKKEATRHSIWDLCSAAGVSFTDPKLDDFFSLIIGRIENVSTILYDIEFKFDKDVDLLRSEWKHLIENRRTENSEDFYGIYSRGPVAIDELYSTEKVVSDYMRLVQTWSLAEFKLNIGRVFMQAGRQFSVEKRSSLLNMFREPEQVSIRNNAVIGGKHGAITLHDNGRVVIAQDNGNASKIANFKRELLRLAEQEKDNTTQRSVIYQKIKDIEAVTTTTEFDFDDDGETLTLLENQIKQLKKERAQLPGREMFSKWKNDIQANIAELVPHKNRLVYTEISSYAPYIQRSRQPGKGLLSSITGFDPVNEWGIHIEHGRDGDKEGIVRWKCCGNSGLDHPGCWVGLPNSTQKEPVPYSFFDRDTFPDYENMQQKYNTFGEIRPAMMRSWEDGTIRGDAFDPDSKSISTYAEIHKNILQLKESLGEIIADAAYQMMSQKSSKNIPWSLFRGMSSRKVLTILKKLYVLEYTYNKPFHLNSWSLPTSEREWKKYIEEDMFQLTKLEKLMGMEESYDKVGYMLGTNIHYVRKVLMSSPLLSAKGSLDDIQRLKTRIDNAENVDFESLEFASDAINGLELVVEDYVEIFETLSKMPGGSRFSYTQNVKNYDKMSKQLRFINKLYITDGIPSKNVTGDQIQSLLETFDEYSRLRSMFANKFIPDLAYPVESLNANIETFCKYAFSDTKADIDELVSLKKKFRGTQYTLRGVGGDITSTASQLKDAMKLIETVFYDLGTVILDTQRSKEINIPKDNSDVEVIEMRKIHKTPTKTKQRTKRPTRMQEKVKEPTRKQRYRRKPEISRDKSLRPPREDILRASKTAGEKVQSGSSLSETKNISMEQRVVYGIDSPERKILTAVSKYFINMAVTYSDKDSKFKINWSSEKTEWDKTYRLDEIFLSGSKGIKLSQIEKNQSVEYGEELSKITNFQADEITIQYGKNVEIKHHAELLKLILDDDDEFGIEKLRPTNEGDGSERDSIWDYIMYVGKNMGVISMKSEWNQDQNRWVERAIFVDEWKSNNESPIITTDENKLMIPGKRSQFKALALREAAMRWYIFSQYVLEATMPKTIYKKKKSIVERTKWATRYEPILEQRDSSAPAATKAKIEREQKESKSRKREMVVLGSVIGRAVDICKISTIDEKDTDPIIMDKFKNCLEQFKMVFNIIKDNSLTMEKYPSSMGYILTQLHLIRNDVVHSSVKIAVNPITKEPNFPDFAADSSPSSFLKLAKIVTETGKLKLYRPIVDIYNDSFKLLTEFMEFAKTPEDFRNQTKRMTEIMIDIKEKAALLDDEWEKARGIDRDNRINFKGMITQDSTQIGDDSNQKYAILQCAAEMREYNEDIARVKDKSDLIKIMSEWRGRLSTCSKVALMLSGSNEIIGEKQREILLNYLILTQIYDPNSEERRTKFSYTDSNETLAHEEILIRNVADLRRLGILMRNFFVAAFVLTDATTNADGYDNPERLKSVSAKPNAKTVHGYPDNGRKLSKLNFPNALSEQIREKSTSIDEDPAQRFISGNDTSGYWESLKLMAKTVLSFLGPTKYLYGTLSADHASKLIPILARNERSIEKGDDLFKGIFGDPRRQKKVEEALNDIVTAAMDKQRNGWNEFQMTILKDFAKKAGLYRPGENQNKGDWIFDIIWGKKPELSPKKGKDKIRILDADMLIRLFRYWGLFIRLLFIIGSKITMDGERRIGYLTTRASPDIELLAKEGGSTISNLKQYVERFKEQATYRNDQAYHDDLYKLVQRFHNIDPNESVDEAARRMNIDDPYETWWDFITDPRLDRSKPDETRRREHPRRRTRSPVRQPAKPKEKVVQKRTRPRKVPTKPGEKVVQKKTRPRKVPTKPKEKVVQKKTRPQKVLTNISDLREAGNIKIEIKNILDELFNTQGFPVDLGKKRKTNISDAMEKFADIIEGKISTPALNRMKIAYPVEESKFGWTKEYLESNKPTVMRTYKLKQIKKSVSISFYTWGVLHIKFMYMAYQAIISKNGEVANIRKLEEQIKNDIGEILVTTKTKMEQQQKLYKAFYNFASDEIEKFGPVKISFEDIRSEIILNDTISSSNGFDDSDNTNLIVNRNEVGWFGEDWPEIK